MSRSTAPPHVGVTAALLEAAARPRQTRPGQGAFGAVHCRRGERQDLRDARKSGITAHDAALDQPARELLDVFSQALLGQACQRRGVLDDTACERAGAVARRVEGAGDDLALSLRQRPGRVLLPATSASATALLRLTVLLRVRTHLENIPAR